MNGGNSKASLSRSPRQIGYDNRTGKPEGIPPEFVKLVVHFPDRIYGTWWYVDDGHAVVEGWYIWIKSVSVLGMTRGESIAWTQATEWETALTEVANRLPKTYTYRL